MNLTLEEMYLISRTDVSSRKAAIRSIKDISGRGDDDELEEITRSTVKKLEAMTDSEFEKLDIAGPEYYPEDPAEEDPDFFSGLPDPVKSV